MIAIILFTCRRLEYAKRTLASLTNLKCSEERWLHIADDGSPASERESLWEQGKRLFLDVSMTNAEGAGYGGSMNLATQNIHRVADLILPLEDDWELRRPLDLDPIAQVIRDGVFGCVRMGYIGATQELRGSFVSANGLWWLALDPDSPEPHVFAGHPRLESVAWERKVGPWPEREGAGATEFAVAHRPEARQGVGWPLELIRPSGDAWAHIGTHKAEEFPLKTVTA